MSTAVGVEAFEDLARMTRTELLTIDDASTLRDLENELRWNAVHRRVADGI
jgi:L-arabinose isomerase